MKLFHPHTYSKLGFDVILEYTRKKAVSEDAQQALSELSPISSSELLISSLHKVRECKDMLEFDDAFPFSHFHSVGNVLHKASVKDNWLNVEELRKLYSWLQVVKGVRLYLQKRKEKYPELDALVNPVPFPETLIPSIDKVLDAHGNIRDDASPELKKIRQSIKETNIQLNTQLNRILKTALENNWTVEKEITFRNDRMVIPIKADAKGRVPGFIQDISQSGRTVFVEPTEALALNNRLRELQIAEQNEIINILTFITAKIYEHTEGLDNFKEIMTELDMVRAKALVAVDLAANLPRIVGDSQKISIREAYYPILQLRARQNPFPIIPLNLQFDKKQRIILISGPNAGGKSVSLKTLGLLQLMLQSGFLIPVDETSEMRLFDSLFIDLGDEQSVENDLSTYTSHLFYMRQMGDKMNHRSLCLIDEFGGGTDPSLGGAIAEAFLERFVRQGAYGIITTHYGNLKEYAQTTEGIGNAAMEFDTKELKPTYRLMQGMPGRSYAFEIAQRVGVHKTILERAKAKLGEEQIQSEDLIQQLQRKNSELQALVRANEKKSKELSELQEKTEAEKLTLKNKKTDILNAAKLEAKKLLQDANKEIERTIREIKENKADKDLTKQIRKDLEVKVQSLEIEEKKVEDAPVPEGMILLPNEKPILNDYVKTKESQSWGVLVEIQGNKAIVEIGNLRVNTKYKDLVKVIPPQSELKYKKPVNVLKVSEIKQVQTQVDVLGMRVEEALPIITKKIDDAIWAGLNKLNILHGRGTGALREAIRKQLRDMQRVKAVYDAPMDQGGDGWTVVELNLE